MVYYILLWVGHDDLRHALLQPAASPWAAPAGGQGGQLPPCALALAPPAAPPDEI